MLLQLKPYVSYRTDVMIDEEKERGTFSSPAVTAETLFAAHYQQQVQEAATANKYDQHQQFSIFDKDDETDTSK